MNLADAMGKAKEIPGKIKTALGVFPRVMINAFDYLTGCLRRNKRSARIQSETPEEFDLNDDGSESRGSIAGKINAFADRFLHRFPEGKRKPVLYGLGGLTALFLILIIALLASNSGKSGKPAP